MPKQTNYILMQNQYPFNQSRQALEATKSFQIKKVIEYDSQPRFIIKQKIRILKSLGFQNLIGLQSTISEENAIILFFQCVPFQFLKEISSLSQQKITKIYNEMLELCESLSTRSIVHDLDVNRVGLDKRFNLKYFLGVDFKIDKGIDKVKKKQSYKNQIDAFFINTCNFGINLLKKTEKTDQLKAKKIETSDKINQNGLKFEINVKKVLNFQPNRQRRILKKSSILDSKQDEIKARKASNRFTFNNDKHIELPIHEKSQETLQKEAPHKAPIKIEDLSVRINKLKCYMKEVTGKMCHRNNVSPVHTDKNSPQFNGHRNNFLKKEEPNSLSPQNTKKLTPSKFAKFEKKVAELRTSKLALTSNHCQNSKKIETQAHETQESHKYKSNHTKSLEQANKQSKHETSKNPELHLCKTVDTPQSPTTDDGVKKNILNFIDDDRQHKQYIMLANKDKYCEQFMNFLEDNNETSLKSSLQNQKNDEPIRISSPFIRQEESPRKKNIHLRQNLKTQSSENAMEIQNRVQKVIRSSLKLINGLRSRQTIRCE